MTSSAAPLWCALLFAMGCSSSLATDLARAGQPSAGKLPPCAVDAQASEVALRAEATTETFSGASGYLDIPPETIRESLARGLQLACDNMSDELAKPMRFHLRGSAEGGRAGWLWFTGVLWIPLLVIPAPIGSGSADVVLDVDYDGTVYTAKATGSVWSGLYYHLLPSEDALVDAVEDAIADIVGQIAAGHGVAQR